MAITMYGIKNCDTIKKARKYLDDQGVEFTFHDYRKDGTDKKLLAQLIKTHGLDTVLNKRGTTWRQLDDKTKTSVTDKTAVALLCEHPAMIKRPVLKNGANTLVGFSADSYADFLKLVS